MIAIGSDHAGFRLKGIVVEYLESKGIKCKDLGTYSTESVHYPEYGRAVAEAVANDSEVDKGIVICSTGIGISIAANKVKGIRASLCTNIYMAKYTRLHNDSNILALGANVIGDALALDILDTWLNTEFEGGRHQIRVDKIMEIES